MTVLADPLVDLLLRSALALVFANAAWHKLRDLHAFRAALAAYRVLPAALVPVAAPGFAAVECALAILLLAPGARVPGAVGAVALLAVYAAAIAINLWRGRRDIDCGCGGPGQPIGAWLVVRNAGLAGAALATLTPPATRALLWMDWLTLAGGLAVLACAWVAVHALAVASVRIPPRHAEALGAGR